MTLGGNDGIRHGELLDRVGNGGASGTANIRVPEMEIRLDAPSSAADPRGLLGLAVAAAQRADVPLPNRVLLSQWPTVAADTRSLLPSVPLHDMGWRSLLGADWQQFAESYLDYDGNPAWLRHFIEDVLPCESSDWVEWRTSGYVSRAQFHVLSWATAVRATDLDRPDDPYAVGANVAWWSNAIEHPGGSGGWGGLQDEDGNYLGCWWQGGWVEP